MARINTNDSIIYGEEFEYKMPSSLASALIAAENKKINNRQQYLIDYVNREFGLKGYCTNVVIN